MFATHPPVDLSGSSHIEWVRDVPIEVVVLAVVCLGAAALGMFMVTRGEAGARHAVEAWVKGNGWDLIRANPSTLRKGPHPYKPPFVIPYTVIVRNHQGYDRRGWLVFKFNGFTLGTPEVDWETPID